MSASRITRKFERFVFNGVTEQPEPIWERDSNTNISVRLSGRSHIGSEYASINPDSKNIGYFTYDFENQTEEYTSNI